MMIPPGEREGKIKGARMNSEVVCISDTEDTPGRAEVGK